MRLKTLFVHFGVFFDNFSTLSSAASKKGILSMRILDMDRRIAFKYPEIESFAISIFKDCIDDEMTELSVPRRSLFHPR